MTRQYLLTLIGVAVIAFFCGKYSAPFKEKTVTVTDTSKDIRIAELERQLKFRSTDTIQVTTTIKRKDGTEVTRVKVENKSVSIDQMTSAKSSAVHDTSHTSVTKEVQNTQGIVIAPSVTMVTADLLHPLYGGIADIPLPLPLLKNVHILTGIQVGHSIGVGGTFAAGLEF